jgi:hypothetical protein
MTDNLPAIPDPATATIATMRAACIDALPWIHACDNIIDACTVLDQVLLVEAILARKKQADDAMTAARWLEVRIGELLGPPRPGERTDLQPVPQEVQVQLARNRRNEFRILARYRDVVAETVPNSRKRILRIIRDYLAATNRQDEDVTATVPQIDIRAGDFRTELADLTDIDAIITDPPYPKEHLPLLADLAQWADKVLTPDGVLAVLMGQTWLPDVYRLLDGGRPYRWTACYLTTGPAYVSHPRRVQSQWKPLLVYGGGPRFSDVITSTGDDKEHHYWGQNYDAFTTIIERLTTPGQLIADPFMGGGTTLLAAKNLGRDAIGCDINPDHVATAQRRLT